MNSSVLGASSQIKPHIQLISGEGIIPNLRTAYLVLFRAQCRHPYGIPVLSASSSNGLSLWKKAFAAADKNISGKETNTSSGAVNLRA
jgi:hypothetical protein